MYNRPTDAVFLLVHSLDRAEKRNFRLYVTRNTSSQDLKVIQLFDALDKMNVYDEDVLMKKAPSITKMQLSNIRAALYKQLLASIRLLRSPDNIEIQMHDQMDYARILYNKGLHHQSLKILDKIKDVAKLHNQVSLLPQVLFLEKKIEALHITRSMEDRAEVLARESIEAVEHLSLITRLSNLALKLYSWYIRHGHARNAADSVLIKKYFIEQLPAEASKATGFYEKMYLYQSYCWYTFITQDFLTFYRYVQKWVDLFEKEPLMIQVETTHYIKAIHNLLGAHFNLQNYNKFKPELDKFEAFSNSELILNNDNNRFQTFVYLYTSKLNQHFLEGTFKEGLSLVPIIENKLNEYSVYLDRHRVLVFYYKIASLYFGSCDYENTIVYLNKIINWKVDLRADLQCYARLLHLIAHYELGNVDILEYLIRSVYRFMSKMESLSIVEEEIFKFIRKTFHLKYRELKKGFEELFEKLISLKTNRYETRAFLYLDVPSWLESKITGMSISEIIRKKFLENRSSGRMVSE